MREEDGVILGEAVQRCSTLRILSITNAQLPMSSLLNGSTSLDLAGKGLGRVEMAITAQLLRSNSSLQAPLRYRIGTLIPERHAQPHTCPPVTAQVLNLSDNLMSRQPLEALTEAIMHGRPPLMEVIFLSGIATISCEPCAHVACRGAYTGSWRPELNDVVDRFRLATLACAQGRRSAAS